MGFRRDLVGGVAKLLADAGVGTWRPSGAWLATDPDPIAVSSMPAAPDRVYVLTAYGDDDDPTSSDGEVLLQVRSRGTRDAFVVDDMDDAVFDVLQGAGPVTLSTGIRLQLASRRSSAYLGVDGNSRHERSSNYALQAWRPSPHRT